MATGTEPTSVFDGSTGRLVEVNDAWLAQYGYSREEALAMTVMDVSAEPDATRASIERATVEGGCRTDLRWHRRKNGSVFPVEITSITLIGSDRPLHCAVLRDVSERRRAEEQRLRSEARFRALVEAMPDGVIVHREARILYANPTLLAMLGYDSEESVRGRAALDLVPPDDRPSVVERVRRIVEEGIAAPLAEERLVRSDGSIVSAEIAAIPIEYDGAPAVLAIVRDVRERKRMEAQLVMSDRLASLGRLAASVGHEINNPVAWVLGNLDLLEREVAGAVELSPELRERLSAHLAIVRDGAERVRDIVRDVRALSSPDAQPVGPVDVRRLVEVCLKMADHEIRPRARVERDLGEPVFVFASEARLGQVILNLLVNAAQAVAPGAPDENVVRVSVRRAGAVVTIEVADTGSGVAPELADRIFEPFFTTKLDNAGTGLGLSICHSIVASLGGTIEVEPNEPRGARFRVTLPSADDEAG